MNTSLDTSLIAAGAKPIDSSILAGMLSASNDACWCMDFGTPVDLMAPDYEVVRQVFENEPVWRMSNPAMAQLYQLPAGKNFNDQPVADIFPRNSQNEEFVRNLIANGFEVDRAPALDRRYDGVEIYVENDVRAHIENGQLIRMFGIVRDIGKHQRREIELVSERDACLEALNAVPMAIMCADERGFLQLANDGAVSLLLSDQNDYAGKDLFTLVRVHADAAFADKFEAAFKQLVTRGISGSIQVDAAALDENWTVTASSGSGAVTVVVTVSAPHVEVRHG